jgi:amino acid permease
VNIFVSLHVILSLTIMFSPVHQEAEDFFSIPQSFSVKRVQVRFLIMLAAIFIAESVPSVGPMMNIVGSTGITIASTIFPALFYLHLSAAEIKQAESASIKE